MGLCFLVVTAIAVWIAVNMREQLHLRQPYSPS